MFFDFFIPLSSKTPSFESFLVDCPLGGCGGLGQLWEALAELWEALGELWEGLYIEKLPINRTSGRCVVIVCISC